MRVRQVDINCKPEHPVIEHTPVSIDQILSSQLSRRGVIQILGAGSLALALSEWPTVSCASSATSKKPPKIVYYPFRGLEIPNKFVSTGKERAVIFVWCDGGLSQLESFNPKPGAPSEIRGHFGAIQTNVPGIIISETMPEMAKIMDKVVVVNSVYSTGIPEHFEQSVHTITCSDEIDKNDNIAHPSWLQRLGIEVFRPTGKVDIPVINSSEGSKPYPFLVPQGTTHIPFSASPNGFPPPYGEPPNEEELKTRAALGRLVGKSIPSRETDKWDANSEAAIQFFLDPNKRKLPEAFDLSKLPESLREEFGKTPFGNACLIALMLVMAGAKFVVIHHGYFDDHYDYIPETKRHFPPFDKGLAALIKHIEVEMGDDGAVAVGTEFGRTPRFNRGKPKADPGRDHWTQGYSVLFAGGGLPGGVVIGATDNMSIVTEYGVHSTGFLPTAYGLGGHKLVRIDNNVPYKDWDLETLIQKSR